MGNTSNRAVREAPEGYEGMAALIDVVEDVISTGAAFGAYGRLSPQGVKLMAQLQVAVEFARFELKTLQPLREEQRNG